MKVKRMGKSHGLSLKKSLFGAIGASAMVFLGAFMVAFLSSSNFAPAFDSQAAEINVNNTATGYYANITTTGAIAIDLEATPDGTAKVEKDTITVNTNAKVGYKLFISTISGATGNGLYLEDDDSKSITASSGTPANPVALATNTWGYIPSRSNSSQTAAEYTNADVAPGAGEATVIGVPIYGNENILYTNNSPTTASTNTLDVYYAANASTALPSGVYSNTVVYTAVVDAVNHDSVDASISPSSQRGLAAGTPITISTGLYPGLSVDNMGEITVTIGGNACTGITPSIATAGNLQINCASPAAPAAGKYDVVITIAKYNKIYTITEGYEYVVSTPEFYTISDMQQMTASVCNSVYTPSNVTGENARIITDPANYTASADGTNQVPSTTLTDTRDGNTYTVRKLADGRCWMTQDLKLDGGYVLDSTNSNLAPGTTYTTPMESTSSSDWCTDMNSACFERSLMRKTGVPNGYLYNWYTATAGTGNQSINTESATSSICPKGWKLPTVTWPDGDYKTMDVTYGGWDGAGSTSPETGSSRATRLSASPLDYNWTGLVRGSAVYSTTSNMYYWYGTGDTQNYAYTFENSPAGGYNYGFNGTDRYYGLAVRCIAAL